MADFTNFDAKLVSIQSAANLLPLLRGVYQQAKIVQTFLDKYVANNDPIFTAAVNALYTAAQRNEMASMSGDFAAVLNWPTTHASALQGE